MSEPNAGSQPPGYLDFEAIVAGSRAKPWRVVHLMLLVLLAALLILHVLAYPGFAVLLLGLIIGLLLVTGFLRGKARVARQDGLLSIMGIAAEKGMPLAPAMAAFASQFRRSSRYPIFQVAERINSGASLSDALKSAPKLLSPDAALLARVGEQAGGLSKGLRAGAQARASSQATLTDIAASISYVLIVLIAIQAITGFLLYFIIPKFEAIFRDFGLMLPGPTRLLIDLSHRFIQSGPFAALIFIAELFLLLIVPYRMSSGWTFDIPFIGRYFSRRHTALILRALSLVVAEGKPISLGLDSLARHYPMHWVRSRLIETEEDVRRGNEWCASLERHGLIRRADGALLAAAQTTGNLSWAMRELADTIDRRSLVRLQAAVQLLFPLVILALGSLLFLIALGYFLPLIRLIERLGG